MDDTEATRLARLAAMEDDFPERMKNFGPGSFGCHEVLDRASIITNLVGDWLLEHPSIVLNAEWFRLADEAQTKLMNLYQAIGTKHLKRGGCEPPETPISPRERTMTMGEYWSDIATAPKNGDRILYTNRFKEVGHCVWDLPYDGEDGGCWWDYERDDEVVPEWWAPALPPPPNTGKGDGA